MRTLITLILISISTLAYSQEYVADTLSSSPRGFLVRYTLVNDTIYLKDQVEQLGFELERIEEEFFRLKDQKREVTKQQRKYQRILDRKLEKIEKKEERFLGPKEKY